jgi:hypothetical protein
MSDFNWCHGPECHTRKTQSRVRGSKGNKVLRTIKIGLGNNYKTNYPEYYMWQYFCNQSCLMDYIRTHLQSIVAIAPRREALETKIKDPKKVTETNSYNNYSWIRTEIETRVDND